MNTDDNIKLIEKLENDFSIQTDSLPQKSDLEEIRSFLRLRVKQMMSGNYQRFLNNLYRIDISESKVSKVFADKTILDKPAAIADLIIERQLQRIKTQRLYREGKL
ncbi:MAG: hypothetical protein K9H48_09990 [Melioribacteraceae bacterium]|nr:hypothetical protein [Melioribacteraceae bacterium]MCF8394397.1 hypothetical protein [Melioribacteraceae bacterium]MCF8417507.1 hypothetical protein [Melioribacteraceae bacterium]